MDKLFKAVAVILAFQKPANNVLENHLWYTKVYRILKTLSARIKAAV